LKIEGIMKTFTEQLDDLRSAAQKIILTHFKDGELHFSDRQLSFEGGGWRHDTYIDEADLYKLSSECTCDLVDELTGNF